ncbi:MAG TPA: Fur family transcriptional regulator [Geobacteraceae bacterium]|jgi:Fe2+ or Zn2+ uptake regulation protein|nr:Fur family transcriptional regulator [Geobacteraceae bacterium]
MPLRHSQTLKSLNMKATPKRLAILTLLGQEMTYAGPEDIWHKLKGQFGRIGLPTVYRNLEELAARGVITKVIHPDRKLYYHFCPNRDHHHHFICLACRKVEDVDACGLEEIEREIGERIGGTVISHLVQVNGLCRTCSAMQEGGSR